MNRNRFLLLVLLLLASPAALAAQVGQTIEVREDTRTTFVRCIVGTIDVDFVGLACPYALAEVGPSVAPIESGAATWTVYAAFLDPAILAREWHGCRLGNLDVIDCRTAGGVLFAAGFDRGEG